MRGLLENSQPDCPWLIVQGEADEVVACNEVVEWINGLEPGPELIVLPDVGHFFHGRLTKLRDTVVSHLAATWAE
jgi:alpha/beta superfamily hydrolase